MNALNEYLTISSPKELMDLDAFVISIAAALALGLVFSFAMQMRRQISKSFAVTLAILPPVVCVVISMVNGSIGAGIAVAGTFSLVRFRSIPGSAREIASVFLAMAIGLACAMGNLLYATLFTLITTGAFLILEHSRFGELYDSSCKRILKITIDGKLDPESTLGDLFKAYTSRFRLTEMKTVGDGDQYRLQYSIHLSDPKREMEFIRRIREVNGNLRVTSSTDSDDTERL